MFLVFIDGNRLSNYSKRKTRDDTFYTISKKTITDTGKTKDSEKYSDNNDLSEIA